MELLQDFGILDVALIAILTISIIIGLIRGAVREVLSLIGLSIAIFLAFKFSEVISTNYVSKFFETERISYIISFILIIICTIFVIALINLLISQLLRASGLSFLDRILGMIFGLFRGAAISTVLVLVLGLVPSVTSQYWWKQSSLAPIFKQIAETSLQFLPDNVAAYFDKKTINNKVQAFKEKVISDSLNTNSKDSKDIKMILESISEPEKETIKPILESYQTD